MGDWNEYYFPQEVLEQADAVRNCTAELEGEIEKLAEKYRNVQKVYIVGSGDCYFISLAAAEALGSWREQRHTVMRLMISS